MNQRHLFLFAFVLLLSLPLGAQKRFSLRSPDGKLETVVSVGQTIEYAVSHDGDAMLSPSAVSMTLAGGRAYGIQPKLSGSSTKTVDRTFSAAVYKRSEVKDHYNELTLRFKGDYQLVFRAYNDGMAYRFVSTAKQPFIVESEQAEFNFPVDSKAILSYANRPEGTLESQYMNSFEQPYHTISLSEWNKKRLGITPVVVEAANQKKICIAEADLLNYPGMFLYPGEKANGLKGVFAPYPKEVEQGGHNRLQELIRSRESYIARFDGATQFPWRIVIVAEKAADLADSDMVYKLSTPPQGDYSWIKPGKVAWEWWNDWNLYQVDFKTGVNNETYQYYIDFASKYGIEYVILDEGWAVNGKADLFQVVPAIDLEALVAYAGKKKVGLILWAGYYAFNRDMENVCKHYSEMGIKGFKVDFMDRDDQPMVDFHHRAAQMGARYHLMIDFHGTYKPTGLQRTYPNVVNFEAVNGLEQLKWNAELDQVTYDVTIPFIRQVAGPMDYTQGAMRNAHRSNYRSVYSEPMSQGTRCRQLAEYVIFESPLNMLCDSPSNYMAEEECTEFIASVPTVWDNTLVLNGEIGQYLSIARRKGNAWYIGCLTNWDARKLELDLSFLGEGNFKGEVFRDGVNAHRVARDYKKEILAIPVNRKLPVSMAPGGGFVIKIMVSD
ncbi:MAG: glycoside hydrolase family 97 protein [Dysgonamonadaceae bacterium]|jgi:alpha-glucosidase|nr:glycoside hydrolase family 97 protein [Dysgonamonadaceae bacterium]